MTLVDTSVWLDHLDQALPALNELLHAEEVCIHPYIIGEIAMGNWKLRSRTLAQLDELPRSVAVRHDEVLQFVNAQKLYGLGVGYIDAHLLAAARVTPDCRLWTKDKRLRLAAMKLGVIAPLN